MKRLNCLIATLIVLGVGVNAPKRLQKTDELIRKNYPVEAIDALKTQNLKMNDMRIFNDFAWGGFLIWKKIQVFIDGRPDLYGEDFLSRYLETSEAGETWQELLEIHQITHILFPAKSKLSVLLIESKNWRLLHEDNVAKVFVRERRGL